MFEMRLYLFILLFVSFDVLVSFAFNHTLDCLCGRRNGIRMKRLAGGEDVKADSEPWFAALVRIDQNSSSTTTTTSTMSSIFKGAEIVADISQNETSKAEKLSRQESGQEQNSNSSSSLDSILEIINYNNNMNSNSNDSNNENNLTYYSTVFENDNRPFCGSTLISDRYLITSASCLKNLGLNQFLIILNLYSLNNVESRDIIKIKPDKVILHPEYDEKADLNNLALIRLAKAIEFRFNRIDALPMCLVQANQYELNDYVLDFYPGSLYTLGYGRLTNHSLHNPLTSSLNSLTSGLSVLAGLSEFLRPPASFDQETKAYPNKLQIAYFRQEFFWCLLFYPNRYMKNRICTTDNRLFHLTARDVCRRDGGGPLVFYNDTLKANTLIGVSQDGYCTGVRPPVFTKIKAYLSWIDQMTIDSEYCRYPDLN